jgi:paraquat-inducible protein B
MSSGAYFKVGVFVILAMAVTVIGIIAVGADELSEDVVTFETYIDESVQGLDVGALVKARSVPMGRVTEIDFVTNRYDVQGQPMRGLIYIQFDLSTNVIPTDDIEASVKRVIDQGLRIRVTSAGITGAMYLEMDFEDEPTPGPEVTWTPKHLYVPSVPSTMKQFVDKAEGALESIQELDLGAIGEKIQTVLDDTDEVITGDLKKTMANIAEASEGLPEAVDDLRAKINDELVVEVNGLVKDLRVAVADDVKPAIKSIDNAAVKLPDDVDRFLRSIEESALRDLGPVVENIEKTTAQLPATVENLNQTLRRIELTVAAQQANLGQTLTNLRRISEDLQELVEDAKRHPSQIIFGDPPRRAKAVGNRNR